MADWLKALDHPPAEIVAPVKPDNAISRLERIAKWKNHPADDLLDWYKDDLPDLAGKSDKDLQAIVCEYLDNITMYRGAKAEAFKPHCVRCIDCSNFTRGSHPHIGKCGAGVNQSAIAGFWDESLRGCSEYREIKE